MIAGQRCWEGLCCCVRRVVIRRGVCAFMRSGGFRWCSQSHYWGHEVSGLVSLQSASLTTFARGSRRSQIHILVYSISSSSTHIKNPAPLPSPCPTSLPHLNSTNRILQRLHIKWHNQRRPRHQHKQRARDAELADVRLLAEAGEGVEEVEEC